MLSKAIVMSSIALQLVRKLNIIFVSITQLLIFNTRYIDIASIHFSDD